MPRDPQFSPISKTLTDRQTTVIAPISTHALDLCKILALILLCFYVKICPMNESFDSASNYQRQVIRQYESEWQEYELPNLIESFGKSWKIVFETVRMLSIQTDPDEIEELAQEVAGNLAETVALYDRIAAIMLSDATPDDVVDWAIFAKRREIECSEEFRHICNRVEITPDDDAVLLSMAQAYADIDTCDGDNTFLAMTYHYKYAQAIRDILGYSISGDQAEQAFVDATGIEFEAEEELDESLESAYIASPDDADGLSEEEIFVETMKDHVSVNDSLNVWIADELNRMDIGRPDALQVAIENYDSAHAKMLDNITRHIDQEHSISLRSLERAIDEMIENLTFLIDTIKIDKDIPDATTVIEKILEDSDLQLSESLVTISATCTPEKLDVLKRRIIIEALLNDDDSEPYTSPFGLTLDEAKKLFKKHILINVFAAKNDS